MGEDYDCWGGSHDADDHRLNSLVACADHQRYDYHRALNSAQLARQTPNPLRPRGWTSMACHFDILDAPDDSFGTE